MKIDSADFNALVAKAMQQAEVAAMRPVIEKELLHYDILYCLDQAGLLNELVFQGGTSLRLCHDGNRFSEDLDFAGGVDFSSARLTEMKTCIEDYIGKRYGLEVTVKEPASLKQEKEYAELRIDKWQINITTAPGQKDMPKQKIKLEVANVPAYTKEALPLRNNYDFLPDGYEDTLVFTETLDEVMADKLISLPATQRYIRHRDLWDLVWLQQQNAQLNPELIRLKLTDYKIPDYQQLLGSRIASLDEIVASAAFHNEMKRFLPTNVYDRTLGQEKFKSFMLGALKKMLTELHTKLFGGSTPEPEFKL
ncbi:MAG: nucleotidyl transferase AbiEii/AbiGii toxin family protein [Gammaproteobacteria bacterium]|nr:nucleotidyl transferase AbiEii/AbiGii toxin family protein [Gammaproteobacteria bacterium]MBU2057396.1 nucleotidyl transferase AbiEii/AbiGii toxin family protein [Gammaproteobacteria bacterium]MBU2176876.1 nucleotidyl transferase AbiEii/AbiGii toxin family protein [Gammaproteobacteria bacterium]MBU2247988.1 nucleotidyl transferase AbiEii/AbiGii toxin family protein [Gammaproteobacteria bacterium]MBU2346365.1 nucleotidyl transferase AbiEii/AbiGii toxin family protein [Gammaproteobacteria bact